MSDPIPLLDVNVLLALANAGHVHHGAAHRWFTDVATWATTPLTEAGFLRLQTNPAVVGRAVPMVEALAALRAMRAMPSHVFLADASSLTQAALPLATLVGHRRVTDFHLANLAVAAGMRLATFDAGIARALGERAAEAVVTIDVAPGPA